MPFMLLIVDATAQRRTRPEAEGRAVYARMQRYGQELAARGKLAPPNPSSGRQAGARHQPTEHRTLHRFQRLRIVAPAAHPDVEGVIGIVEQRQRRPATEAPNEPL